MLCGTRSPADSVELFCHDLHPFDPRARVMKACIKCARHDTGSGHMLVIIAVGLTSGPVAGSSYGYRNEVTSDESNFCALRTFPVHRIACQSLQHSTVKSSRASVCHFARDSKVHRSPSYLLKNKCLCLTDATVVLSCIVVTFHCPAMLSKATIDERRYDHWCCAPINSKVTIVACRFAPSKAQHKF
jgi:hypothetical protein